MAVGDAERLGIVEMVGAVVGVSDGELDGTLLGKSEQKYDCYKNVYIYKIPNTFDVRRFD